MNPSATISVECRCQQLSLAIGWLVAVAGTLVLIGWWRDIPALKSILPVFITMKPLTAAGFLCAGVVLYLGAWRRLRQSLSLMSMDLALAALIAALGLVTMIEYLAGVSFGVDGWLFPQALADPATPFPGRMAPSTAFCFFLFGSGYLALHVGTLKGTPLAHWLALLISIIGLVALLGYLYGAPELYRFYSFKAMALHTVLLFILLGFGLLLLAPDQGFMGTLISPRSGGVMARYLLPLTIPVPIMIGWLQLTGREAGVYQEEFGLALFAGSSVVIFSVLTWGAARMLNRSDERRVDTSRRLQEAYEELATANLRLQAAMEVGGMGTWLLDLRTGLVQADPALVRLLEAAPTTPKLATWIFTSAAYHVEDRPRIEASLAAAAQQGADYDVECRLVHPDGSVHWVSSRGRPEFDANGVPTRMPGACVDITAQKRSEDSLRQSQKMEALGTLAGGIAHDFNNILAAIGGNAELADADLEPQHPVRSNLDAIRQASRRAADIVRQILTFSRRQEVERKTLSLQPVVEEAIKLLRATLPAMITIRTEFTTTVSDVCADATQIHQVIMNLGINAAHAMVSGGVLGMQLDTVMVDADYTKVSAELPPGRYVRLSVSDTGCGMDAAVITRIFEPFYTTKAPGQGTGLGLATVHGIMKGNGGAITVYSELGKGSTFHLYFPAIEAAGHREIKEPVRLPRGCGQHVLVVDDEKLLVVLTTRMLQRLGYQVTGHTDPLLAAEAFRKAPESFQVVISDLSMPGLSGMDLARQMLQIRDDLPIVLNSGYINAQDREAGTRLGIRGVIAKPFSIDELARAVHQALVGTEAEVT